MPEKEVERKRRGMSVRQSPRVSRVWASLPPVTTLRQFSESSNALIFLRLDKAALKHSMPSTFSAIFMADFRSLLAQFFQPGAKGWGSTTKAPCSLACCISAYTSMSVKLLGSAVRTRPSTHFL